MSLWIRQWKKTDLNEIAGSLLVIGVLHAECFACHNIGISKDSRKCPECGIEFKYAGFRENVNYKELEKLSNNRNLQVIDFDDFIKIYKRKKAEGFLGNR